MSNHRDRGKIDPARARRQHEDYREILEPMVKELIVLPKQDSHPDSCFTQDTAVVLEGHALIARTGIPTRYGESATISRALGPLVKSSFAVPPPGTLEGGDVIRLGRRLLVGRSRRTSAAGFESIKVWAEPLGYQVESVAVPTGILHLSTAVSVIREDLVMGLPQVLEDEAFDTVSTLPVRDDPIEACNVLVIGDRAIASGDYRTHTELEKAGLTVHRPDLQEFSRADGGPTCLALLVW